MFDNLFPQSINNAYRGYKVALWLFGLVVGVRIAQSILVIFNGYSTARDADGIPLDTYTPDAAQTAVALFAQGALSRLLISLLCVLVLWRFRNAVPFMFVLLLLNYLASKLIFPVRPVGPHGNTTSEHRKHNHVRSDAHWPNAIATESRHAPLTWSSSACYLK